MPLLRLLPERWQKFVREALKFGIVGGVNTVINYGVSNVLLLTVFRNGQLKATALATFIAAIASYFMNRHWTYRDRPKSAIRRESLLFFLFNATGLLIELGVVGLAKYGFGVTGLLGFNIAKTGGVVLGTAFRFWSYRSFVFRPETAPADRSVAAEFDPATEPPAAPAGPMVELEEIERERVPLATAGTPAPRTPLAGLEETGLVPVAPLGSGLAGSIDADLEAELAAELHAASGRPIHR